MSGPRFRWRGRGGGKSRSSSGPKRARLSVVPGSSPPPVAPWPHYFPTTEYCDDSPLLRKAVAVEHFLSHRFLGTDWHMDTVLETSAFPLDYKVLIQPGLLGIEWPAPEVDLEVAPEVHLGCLGLGIYFFVKKQLELENPSAEAPLIEVQLLNHSPILSLRHLKCSLVGKLVTFQGTVIRVSAVKLAVTRMGFLCSHCGSVVSVPLAEGGVAGPSRCPTRGCRSLSFEPVHNSSCLVQVRDIQTIRIQEMITEEERDCGRMPSAVDVELKRVDLTSICLPGDPVVVTGIFKTVAVEDGSSTGGGNLNKSIFGFCIDAITLINLRAVSTKGCSESDQSTTTVDSTLLQNLPVSGGVQFTELDYEAIRLIQCEKELLRLLVASLCPSIFGHELVKTGLILSLFGGVAKGENSGAPIRGDIHILIVGDPGLGKSQMLKATANVSPRGVFVCGNTSTSAGLTVAMSKDGGLEAGALVLSDQGICCIDEFDKMSSQHMALLEVMEQQQISLAKAGLSCSLPARATIAAAANPTGGHYDKSKTVSENLRLNPALLSRFDLVFILLDLPNEENDVMLSKHVMQLHWRKGAGSANASLQSVNTAGTSRSRNDSSVRDQSGSVAYRSNRSRTTLGEGEPFSLIEKLRFDRDEEVDLIPHQLLRKYVAYARRYVNPKLSVEACEVLQNFYSELRKRHQMDDCTPITTRQLESLARLTEARARLELRESATAQDAEDVVEVMRFSMIDTFTDELGLVDFNRSQHGSGMSQRAQCKRFIASLRRVSDVQKKTTFSLSEMKDIATQAQIQTAHFGDFVESLNNQGFLLKKGPRLYQLQAADF